MRRVTDLPVGRPKGLSMADATDEVSVDLLDHAPSADPVARPTPRRRIGLVAVLVAVVVLGLLLWPEPGGTDPQAEPGRGAAVPPPTDPRLLPWPGRGPAVTDQALIGEAAQAWRDAVLADGPDSAPGSQVHPLWAGTVGQLSLVLLQSVGVDGVARVAQVSQVHESGQAEPGPLELVSVAKVTSPPEFLALTYTGWLDLDAILQQPGSALIQVLPAPALLAPDEELKRQEGEAFRPIGIQDNELSQPWVHSPWQSASGPLVLRTRDVGLEPGVRSAATVVPGELLPAAPPVELVAPDWGRTRRDLPEDHLDAQSALAAAGLTSGRAAILATTITERGRASLVEVRADAQGSPLVVTVLRDGRSMVASSPRPAGPPTDVALGAVRTLSGETVVVAAGTPQTSLIVLGADGDPVGTGPRSAAVVLGRDREVREVAAQGYRQDETFVGRTTLDVSDL